MTTSYRALRAALKRGTQHILSTSAEVDGIAGAAEQLAALHYRNLASPWDVPKLLCAVLRVQLNARLTKSDNASALPLPCFLRLLAVSWQMCPLTSLPLPIRASPASCASITSATSSSSSSLSTVVIRAECLFSISRRDIERVAVELGALRGLTAMNSASSAASLITQSSGEGYRTALSVVLALLGYWHVIAAEEDEGNDGESTDDGSKDGGFHRVSETVWRCVQRWTMTDTAAAGARGVALAAWLCTVLRRALRSSVPTPLIRTVEWLESFLSSSSSSTGPAALVAPVHDTFASAALDECWARLHTRVYQHVCRELHNSQAALKAHWTGDVAPALSQAFAHEPPLLSGASLRAFHFGGSLEKSLGVLAENCYTVYRASDAPSSAFYSQDSAAIVAPLLRLAALQQHVEAAELRVSEFITPQTYTTYLRPIVAVCLRWGLVDTARALLDRAFTALDDHGKEWQERLLRRDSFCNPMAKTTDAASMFEVAAAEKAQREERRTRYIRGFLYPQWLQEQQEQLCLTSEGWLTVPYILNTLVQCDNVHHLRLICDALLRCPAPWSTQVLTDPFAAFFILQSLAKVAAHYLDVGDPPLARYYIALLGQLLPRYLCPTLLSDLVYLLYRLTCTLSSYIVSPLNYSVPSTTHGESILQWRQAKAYFDNIAPRTGFGVKHDSASSGVLASATHTIGMAWKARREFQRHCACTPSPHLLPCEVPTQLLSTEKIDCRANARCTVVEVHYTADKGGTLRLQCSQLNRGASTIKPENCGEPSVLPGFTVYSSSVGERIRACAADMTDILRCNRAQLLHGTGRVETAGEKALCADSRVNMQNTSHLSTTDWLADAGASQHEGAKMLNTDVQRVEPASPAEAAGQEHYDPQECKRRWWRERYALDARISQVVASLQSTLGALRVLLSGRPSDTLTAQLSSLAMHFATQYIELCNSHHSISLEALHQVTTFVVLGGPCLWATVQNKTDAQPTCVYCPVAHETCPVCASTLRNVQNALLRTIVDLGQGTAPPVELAHRTHNTGVDADDDDGWMPLLVDTSVIPLVDELASAALEAYYHESARYTCDKPETPLPHRHLDLLLHPREHTYLVLSGELHGLPWEGLDVCRDRSTSRVPSLDYLHHAFQSLADSAVSLRRTFVYCDCEVLQSQSGLMNLIDEHPGWEVAYGKTLSSAAAAQKNGWYPSESSTALLRRVLGSAEETDHLDAYVYAGHRGGEQLISRAALYEWLPSFPSMTSSLVLLMGCSSARMAGNAKYDAFGLPHAYLSAGVSCFVGCLWDVTDGDVDRLTCRLLRAATTASTSTKTQNVTTVGEALAVARRACRLRCLTGLSTVFYGVNLPLDKINATEEASAVGKLS